MHQFSPIAAEFTRRRLAKRLCTYINREPERNYKFIKDIIPNKGIDTAQQIISAYNNYKPSQKNKIFIIGHHKEKEGEHLHFYHNCRYTQSNCRCGFIDNIEFKRREPKYIITDCPYEDVLFDNILKYLSKEGRDLIHVQIGSDSCGEIIHRFKNLRLTGDNQDNTTNGIMEACEHEMQNGARKRDGSFDVSEPETKRIKRIISEGYDELSEFRAGSGIDQRCKNVNYLTKNILKVLATPIEAACNTQHWNENARLSIFDSKNQDYITACSSIMKLTSQLSFEEIYEIHMAKGCLQTYCSRTDVHYFSREDSLPIIERLLQFQYTDFKPFLKNLYDICERNIPKKNTLFVQGKSKQLLLNPN